MTGAYAFGPHKGLAKRFFSVQAQFPKESDQKGVDLWGTQEEFKKPTVDESMRFLGEPDRAMPPGSHHWELSEFQLPMVEPEGHDSGRF